MLAGQPTITDARAPSSNVNAGNLFNSPDGLAFDSFGRLWIQTDGNYGNTGDFANMGNNQMLVGDPATGEIARFLVGPKGAEVTVQNAMPMSDFESKTLNRKFDVVFFGTLESATPAADAPRAPAKSRILLGLIPELNIFKQKARFRPLGEYLTKRMGVPVEFTILSRYGNIIESFQSERMDGAFFGSFTGALAIERGLACVEAGAQVEAGAAGRGVRRQALGDARVEETAGDG